MGKEREAAAGTLLSELFQVGIYKRNQGRITRQVTFAALAGTIALGCWRLSSFVVDGGLINWLVTKTGEPVNTTAVMIDAYVIPGVLAVVGIWLSYRLVNYPRFADFLIAVEAEMNKVSWPSRTELFRASVVVLVTIFGLAFILYGYDLIWQQLLRTLGVIGAGG